MLFLIDAQLPISLAEALRQAGFRAAHVAEIGLLTASDQDNLERGRRPLCGTGDQGS